MDVDLDQRAIPDGFDAVNLAGLDNKSRRRHLRTSCPFTVRSAAFPDKLNFVVGMAVWARAFAR